MDAMMPSLPNIPSFVTPAPVLYLAALIPAASTSKPHVHNIVVNKIKIESKEDEIKTDGIDRRPSHKSDQVS